MIKSRPFTNSVSVQLTPQQQKILRSHSTNLDLAKYKNGKKFYTEFIGSLASPEAHRRYLAAFEEQGYMNKMLIISSVKYYRDIKMLLIGVDEQGEWRVKPGEIIERFEDIAEGREQGSKKEEEKEKQEELVERKMTMTAVKTGGLATARQMKTEQKPSHNKIERKTNRDEAGRGERRQPNTTGMKVQKMRPEIETPLPNQSQSSVSEVKYQKIDPSEYKYLKLIQIQSKQNKNKPQAVKSDRQGVSKADSEPGDRSATAISVRSYGKSTKLIKDLKDNSLYSKHHNKKEGTKPMLSSKPSLQQSTPQVHRTAIERKTSTMSASKAARRRQNPGICDRIMLFLRSFLVANPQPSSAQKPYEQQKQQLIKKTSTQLSSPNPPLRKPASKKA